MPVRKETVRSGWYEIAGILLFALAALLFLSLASYDPADVPALQRPPNLPPVNLIGPAGAWTAFVTLMSLGVTAFLLPVALAAVSALMLFQREGRIWPRAAWMAGVLVALAGLVDLRPAWWLQATERLNTGTAGGLLGDAVGRRMLAGFMGEVGALIVLAGLLLAGVFFLFQLRPREVAEGTVSAARSALERWGRWRAARRGEAEQIEHEAREVARQRRRLERALQRDTAPVAAGPGVQLGPAGPARPAAAKPAAPAPAPAPEPHPPPAPPPPEDKVRPPPPAPPAPKPAPKPPPPPVLLEVEPAAAKPAGPAAPWKLPPLSCLAPLPPEGQREIAGEAVDAGQILVDTLAEFGIEAQLTHRETGPVVTRYELLPAAGVKVERIAGLSNNIALAMKAESVRVQAPIPGKGVVGIEVPNVKTQTVYLREVIESEVWHQGKAALPLALGKDVGGRVIVADLAEMPHLLIAGATGSGKTVCMNSVLCGLLMARTPDELKLILVDPKIVEFASYNNIPHLVVPVITDPKKVALGLRWAITEMERRYKLFARAGVRNIRGFNARPIAKQGSLFGDEPAAGGEEAPAMPDRLPYIVVVVDELADLMLVAQADIENSIARLAQLSRAVGIHMVLATQRPSVNVITGTIKANFPARIAFQVAQRVDSRTILDANGADKLLGKGDMLFLPPGSSKLIRAQGCFTADAEAHAVVGAWRQQGEPQYELEIKAKIEKGGAELPDLEENDELIEQAVEIIRQTHRASTSSLQRRLRIGYTRAARIMDLLEERGIVGPAQGSDPREILIDLDGEIPANDGEDGNGETP